jgi:hypothetical protein
MQYIIKIFLKELKAIMTNKKMFIITILVYTFILYAAIKSAELLAEYGIQSHLAIMNLASMMIVAQFMPISFYSDIKNGLINIYLVNNNFTKVNFIRILYYFLLQILIICIFSFIMYLAKNIIILNSTYKIIFQILLIAINCLISLIVPILIKEEILSYYVAGFSSLFVDWAYLYLLDFYNKSLTSFISVLPAIILFFILFFIAFYLLHNITKFRKNH